MKWIGQHIYDLVSRFRNDVIIEGKDGSIITIVPRDTDPTLSYSRAIEAYYPVNDASPSFVLGSGDNERFTLRSFYQSGTQTLQTVTFSTKTESATANYGLFRFGVDGTNILDIDDGGIDLDANMGISINGTDILTDSSGTATLSNIDALDATTEATIEAAIDTLSNLTSIGTIVDGVWNGDVIASAYLDADTAHLSGSQTFTGAKKFNEIVSAIFEGDRNVTPGDGAVIHVDSHDVTDTSTSASGTAAMYTHVNIEAPRLLATNASVTTTAAATLYISGAPSAGTNQTVTNNYALWVDAGLVKFDGALTVDGTITGTLGTAAQPNIESIGTDGDTLAILADELQMSNTTANMPKVKLTNTTDDTGSSALIFEKLRDDDGVAQGQNLGVIRFRGQDASQNTEDYAYIIGEIDVSTHGQESGQLVLGVANHDGGNGNGLILTGGSEDNEIDVTVGLGANSVVTIPGNIDLAGDIDVDGTLETDALTIGGSALTSIFYARSVISFQGQASMLSSGNWVAIGQNGISNHTWSLDIGVNTETNGSSAGSLAKQYGHEGVRMPYACTIENIYCTIRNASGNRQVTVGLFCARAADDTGGSGLPVAWGTTTATAPVLQIHADANNESGSYINRPTHAEVSTDVAMAAGDLFYPAIKLTGVTSGGATDTVLASFSVGIKTLIA